MHSIDSSPSIMVEKREKENADKQQKARKIVSTWEISDQNCSKKIEKKELNHFPLDKFFRSHSLLIQIESLNVQCAVCTPLVIAYN